MISVYFLAQLTLYLLIWSTTWKNPYEYGASNWDFMRSPAQDVTFVTLLGAKLFKRGLRS